MTNILDVSGGFVVLYDDGTARAVAAYEDFHTETIQRMCIVLGCKLVTVDYMDGWDMAREKLDELLEEGDDVCEW